MKRKANRQKKIQKWIKMRFVYSITNRIEVIQNEIVIFKKHQYPDIGYQTNYQGPFSFYSLGFAYPNTRIIVDYDGKQQYKNVFPLKKRIENTARSQQQHPSIFVRKYKKKKSNYGKEKNKLERIKKHIS
jgi:hypothetical protein